MRFLFAFHAALDSSKSNTKGANNGRASFACERVCTMVNNDWMLSCHYFAKESILFASFWKSAHRIAANLCAAAALGLAVFMTTASLACGSTFGGGFWLALYSWRIFFLCCICVI